MLAAAGFAYPNVNATTGIFGVPNALTVPNGTLDGAADILFVDSTTVNARAVLGLTGRFEVGAGVTAGDNTGVGITGKYRLPILPQLGTVALGLSFADINDTGSGYQLFGVATKALTGATSTDMRLLGTLGVTFTNFEDRSGILPFVGAQLQLPQNFEIAGEFELEAGDFDESITSLLLRKQVTDRIGGEIGFTNATGFLGTSDHDLFLGLSYAFGAR
jgi:hypothetical protein